MMTMMRRKNSRCNSSERNQATMSSMGSHKLPAAILRKSSSPKSSCAK